MDIKNYFIKNFKELQESYNIQERVNTNSNMNNKRNNNLHLFDEKIIEDLKLGDYCEFETIISFRKTFLRYERYLEYGNSKCLSEFYRYCAIVENEIKNSLIK